MKIGQTMEELAAEVARQAEARRDFVAPLKRLSFLAHDGRLSLSIPPAKDQAEAAPFEISRHTHGQIASHLTETLKAERFGTSYRALLAQHPDLLANLVNGLFERSSSAHLVRTLDGRARAFLSNRYRAIDNDLVMEAAVRALAGAPGSEGMTVHSAAITEQRLYLKVGFPSIRGEVGLGDVVESGVMISNSEIGQGSVNVRPFVTRLVCMNGMVIGAKLAQYHVGRARSGEQFGEIDFRTDTLHAENKAFLLRLRDAIGTAVNQQAFERTLGRFRAAAELQAEAKPADVVEVLSEQIDLSQDERGSVLQHFIAGRDLSQWGLANAVTRAAEDAKDYDRATELETAGGQVIELKPEQWVRIATAGIDDGGSAQARVLVQARRLLAA